MGNRHYKLPEPVVQEEPKPYDTAEARFLKTLRNYSKEKFFLLATCPLLFEI